MKTYYFVFDRLSKRHDWQSVGSGDSQEWKDWVVRNTVSNYEKWQKKDQYPDYQVGVMVYTVSDYYEIPEDVRKMEIKKQYNPVIIYQNGEYD